MPLEDLVVSGAELDRELVATVLAPLARLDGDARRVLFLPGWDKLNNERKILAYLVGRKAMRALEWVEEEGVLPRQVSLDTGLPGGSVRPSLGRLVDGRLVAQAGEGRYVVPNWAMNRVREVLTDSTKQED